LPTVWLFPILAVLATPPVVERDGVRIDAAVHAQIYEWTITNVDAPPIMSVEIEQNNSYNPLGPAGWTTEIFEDGAYRAWTTDPRRAIRKGKAETFSVRVGSAGAVLGVVSATIGFESSTFANGGAGTAGADPPPVLIPAMWGTVKPSLAPGLAIAATLALVGILHGAVLERRARRSAA